MNSQLLFVFFDGWHNVIKVSLNLSQIRARLDELVEDLGEGVVDILADVEYLVVRIDVSV